MKRILGRIFGILLILIFAYQPFCYADVGGINYYPIDEFGQLIGLVGVGVLVTSAISFFY